MIVGDSGGLCVHHEFKDANKIFTLSCKTQNSLEFVSWRIFLFFFFPIPLSPMKVLLHHFSITKCDGSPGGVNWWLRSPCKHSLYRSLQWDSSEVELNISGRAVWWGSLSCNGHMINLVWKFKRKKCCFSLN